VLKLLIGQKRSDNEFKAAISADLGFFVFAGMATRQNLRQSP